MYIIGIIILLTVLSCINIWYCNPDIFQEEADWSKRANRLILRKNTKCFLVLGILGGLIVFLIHYKVYDYAIFHSIKMICIYLWLLPVAYIDYKKKIIPNKWIVAGLILFALLALIEIFVLKLSLLSMLKYYFTGFLLGFGVFLLCMVFTKKGIGMGDLKLYSLLGMLLGWEGVFNVLFLTIVGMVIYGIYTMLGKKQDKHTLVPMGPFTFVAMLLAMLLGI